MNDSKKNMTFTTNGN